MRFIIVILALALAAMGQTIPTPNPGDPFPLNKAAGLSNSGTAVSTPLPLNVQGLAWPAVTVTPAGTTGSTAYAYTVVGYDVSGNTRAMAGTTATGNASLSAGSYNRVAVAAWSITAPYIAPVGSCDVMRTIGGATQGKIGVIATCSGGGYLDDTGLAGGGETVPPDTSGVSKVAGQQTVGKSSVVGDQTVGGNQNVGGTQTVTGAATFSSTLSVGATAPASGASQSIAVKGRVYGAAYDIATWGDSLTAGNSDSSGITYPASLAALLGMTSYNGGVGGEGCSQIQTRMLAATDKTNAFVVIWAGRNDIPTYAADIAPCISAMVAALPTPKRYLVLSVLNASTETTGTANHTAVLSANAALASAFSGHYLDIRALLIDAYDGTISQDVTDHGNDVVPSSLMFDTIHLNGRGYLFVARQVATWIETNDAIVQSQTSQAGTKALFAAPPAIGSITTSAGNFSSIGIGCGPGSSLPQVCNATTFTPNKFLEIRGDNTSTLPIRVTGALGSNYYDIGRSTATGYFTFTGTQTGYVGLAVNGPMAPYQSTPANAAIACSAGAVWTDADYIYVCTATGVVKRAAIAGW